MVAQPKPPVLVAFAPVYLAVFSMASFYSSAIIIETVTHIDFQYRFSPSTRERRHWDMDRVTKYKASARERPEGEGEMQSMARILGGEVGFGYHCRVHRRLRPGWEISSFPSLGNKEILLFLKQ